MFIISLMRCRGIEDGRPFNIYGMSFFFSQTRNIFDTKQEFIFIGTNLNVIFIQILKKKLHLSGHYIFFIKIRYFYLPIMGPQGHEYSHI
jgi:hypothetical protein